MIASCLYPHLYPIFHSLTSTSAFVKILFDSVVRPQFVMSYRSRSWKRHSPLTRKNDDDDNDDENDDDDDEANTSATNVEIHEEYP